MKPQVHSAYEDLEVSLPEDVHAEIECAVHTTAVTNIVVILAKVI